MSYISAQPSFIRQAPKRRNEPRPELQKLAGIGIVVLFHIGVGFALVSTLAYRTTPVSHRPLQIIDVAAQTQVPDRAPPPPPTLAEPPKAYIPPVEIVIQAAPQSTAIQAITTAKPVVAPVAAAPPPPTNQIRVEPELDSASSQDPEYPPLSRRLNEEGLVSLLVLVTASGVVDDVRIEHSSGFRRLDDAAIAGARTRSHFIPGTLDGKPVPMWYRYRYEFHVS